MREKEKGVIVMIEKDKKMVVMTRKGDGNVCDDRGVCIGCKLLLRIRCRMRKLDWCFLSELVKSMIVLTIPVFFSLTIKL